MAIGVNITGITCFQPAIIESILRSLVIIVIAEKISRGTHQYFLIFRNFHFSQMQRFPHSFQLYFLIRLNLKYSSRLGETIALFEIQTNSTKEKNYIGTDGMAAGKSTVKFSAAQTIKERPVNQKWHYFIQSI